MSWNTTRVERGDIQIMRDLCKTVNLAKSFLLGGQMCFFVTDSG